MVNCPSNADMWKSFPGRLWHLGAAELEEAALAEPALRTYAPLVSMSVLFLRPSADRSTWSGADVRIATEPGGGFDVRRSDQGWSSTRVATAREAVAAAMELQKSQYLGAPRFEDLISRHDGTVRDAVRILLDLPDAELPPVADDPGVSSLVETLRDLAYAEDRGERSTSWEKFRREAQMGTPTGRSHLAVTAQLFEAAKPLVREMTSRVLPEGLVSRDLAGLTLHAFGQRYRRSAVPCSCLAFGIEGPVPQALMAALLGLVGRLPWGECDSTAALDLMAQDGVRPCTVWATDVPLPFRLSSSN